MARGFLRFGPISLFVAELLKSHYTITHSSGLYLLAWPYTIESPTSSNFFSLHYYISHHAQADLLSHKDLDMALTGAMMALTNNGEHITDGGHTVEERQRAHTTYMHNGCKVCQQTFRFLHRISKERLLALKITTSPIFDDLSIHVLGSYHPMSLHMRSSST